MDRPICRVVQFLTFRELLAVLREILLEIEFRIDTGLPLELSTSPSGSEYGEDPESETDSDL